MESHLHGPAEEAPREASSACQVALDALAQLGPPALLMALAGRPRVAASLAGAIVAHGDPAAVNALMSNPGAEIRRETFARALAARPSDDRLHAAMIARAALPPEIVQRLGVLVSADRLPDLVRRHATPPTSDTAATEPAVSRPGGEAGVKVPLPARDAPRATARGLTKTARVAADVHR